jgi:hypothetical protein
MEIKLSREDIIQAIDSEYRNDSQFIIEIIDNTTTSWNPVRDIIRRLVEQLIDHEQIGELDDIIKQDE